MKIRKLIGIWMDHSVAHLLELKNNAIVSETIEIESFFRDDEGINWKDENLIQTKEQNSLSNYFDKIVFMIKDFDELLLFGPTDAKKELFNLIDTMRNLDMIKITIKTVDKMTDNQEQAFVREFFSKTGQQSKNLHNTSFSLF